MGINPFQSFLGYLDNPVFFAFCILYYVMLISPTYGK